MALDEVISKKENSKANCPWNETKRFLPRNGFKKMLVIYPYIEYKFSIRKNIWRSNTTLYKRSFL